MKSDVSMVFGHSLLYNYLRNLIKENNNQQIERSRYGSMRARK